MEAPEIDKMPVCICGTRTELTVTHNGWYVVKCPSCGKTSEEQSTLQYAVGAFLAKIYKTPLACFIGCLASEIGIPFDDPLTMKILDSANRNEYSTAHELIAAKLSELK